MRISAEQMDELVHTLASTMLERDGLRNILDTMLNSVFILSPDGVVIHLNRAASQLADAHPSELVGEPIHHVLRAESCWWELSLTEILHQGAIRNREVYFKSRMNRHIPTLFSASVQRIRDDHIAGIICCVQDVSEHIRLREALKNSHDSFQAIVHKSVDGIIIVDQDGMVCFANPAAVFLLGRNSQEMIGMHFGHPLIVDESTEVDIIRKNGDVGVAEMRAVASNWHGQNALLVSLRDVTENVRLREQLQQLSMEDPLTGLHNRRSFMLLAEQEVKASTRTGNHVAMIFIDLDGMKAINDTLGHKVGDHALLETASILRKVFRKSDLLSRQGGDEFLALVTNKETDDAELHNTQVLHRLEHEVFYRNSQSGRLYTLSLSIGVVLIDPSLHTDIEYYIQQADIAMYQAKKNKRMCRSQ